tara:strand:- start:142 stop:495 length:354 start_codon:yes stop_codon:yes gene_type:complete
MKKIIITLSICLAFALSSNAQNQLTFNQVLLVPLTTQGDTVPQGKVWKVESAVSNSSLHTYFYVDAMECTLLWAYVYSNNPSVISSNTAFPMWLPAGTIVTSGIDVLALSIIEFNIE